MLDVHDAENEYYNVLGNSDNIRDYSGSNYVETQTDQVILPSTCNVETESDNQKISTPKTINVSS